MRRSRLQTVEICALALVAVLTARASLAAPPGQQGDARETINTQDPGYLKLPVRILDRSTMEVLTFRPELGETATVSFRLTRPAEIRIRVVRREPPGFLVRTLRDWTPLELGRHEFEWDGRDASGNTTDHRGVRVVFEAKAEEHARHLSERCHELAVRLVDGGGPGEPAGRWTVRLVGDGAYGPSTGYRVVALLDERLWVDESHPGATTTFELPRAPAPLWGEHVLAVIVGDGRDHLGAASVRFVVK